MAGFAVVDVETTGLSPVTDRILEIGVVLLDKRGQFVGEWSSLVNPLRPVAAEFIHGITDDDVADSPTFSDVLPQLSELLEGRAVTAHNATFDVGFLNAAFQRSHFPMRVPPEATVCTMELSKIYLPRGRHSLASAAERAGIALPNNHHRALADARTAGELLRMYLQAEARGQRYRAQASSRTGHVTKPASWIEAQMHARALCWPTCLF